MYFKKCLKLFATFLIIVPTWIECCANMKPTVREIQLPNGDPLNVLDSNGWIIIQRRFDGSQDFDMNWQDYADGFGELHGEFFIGLEKLHLITSSKRYVLNVSLEVGTNTYDVQYDNFRVGNSNSSYELASIGQFKGYEEMNILRWIERQPFKIIEAKDTYPDWAYVHSGGWWFAERYLPACNLNGRFSQGFYWEGYKVKSAIMKIRPHDDLNSIPYSKILSILYKYFFHL